MHKADSISAAVDGSGTSAVIEKVSPARRPAVLSSQSVAPASPSGSPKWNSAHSGVRKSMPA